MEFKHTGRSLRNRLIMKYRESHQTFMSRTSCACLTCIVMGGSLVDLNHPFVSILYYLCQVVTSLTWGTYCLYGTLAQCNWVTSNRFFITLIIRIAWRAWCGCDESPCIIYQGDVSKGFDDMIWTDVGNVWETSYMIVLVIELNLTRA